MIGRYENIFKNIDTGGISSAINNFIESLNDVNYESSGCFMMATNAKYDSTFNDGVDYLKNTDINGMIEICEKCIELVVNKIIKFNEYYNGPYDRVYNTYVEAYNKLKDTPKTVTKHYIGSDGTPSTETIANPAYAKAKYALKLAQYNLNLCHVELKNEEDSIQSVTFS